MPIYRFRITFEDYDDISRDIEIRPTQTFEDFHYSIQSAIGFDASKPASFYMSDDYWKKGKEITSKELSGDEAGNISAMSKSRLCDFIADPHQKIYYVFDFITGWSFHIVLLKILPNEDAIGNYPRCMKVTGESPKQYPVTTPEALPVPDEFDLEGVEEPEDEMEEEVLGTSEDELPLGEETDKSFIAVSSDGAIDVDEFETAGDDAIDDESIPESDDF